MSHARRAPHVSMSAPDLGSCHAADIPFSLEPHMDAIYRCFGNTNKDRSVKDIVANLGPSQSGVDICCACVNEGRVRIAPRSISNRRPCGHNFTEKEDSDWARETIAVLMTKSPIALEVIIKKNQNQKHRGHAPRVMLCPS